MAKKKPETREDKAMRGAIPVPMQEGGDFDAALAKATLQPVVQAARTLHQSQGDQHTVSALVNELKEQVRTSQGGSIQRSESMLISQAHTLDELFHVLTRKALLNFGSQYLDAGERYMRLALKAQSQARTTLETLATIKNPPIFAKQANIAHGPQQVNNGSGSESSTRGLAREEKTSLNELLEDKPSEWMDNGTKNQAGRGDSHLASMAEFNGPANQGRKVSVCPERKSRRRAAIEDAG